MNDLDNEIHFLIKQFYIDFGKKPKWLIVDYDTFREIKSFYNQYTTNFIPKEHHHPTETPIYKLLGLQIETVETGSATPIKILEVR